MIIAAWLLGFVFLILGFAMEGVEADKNLVCSQVWFAAAFIISVLQQRKKSSK